MLSQWLDPDERAAWLALIRIVAKLPATLDAQLMRERATAGPNGQAKTTFVIACSRSSDPHSSPPELS